MAGQFSLVTGLLLIFGTHALAALPPSCNDVELASLQAAAATSNLANVYTTRAPDGGAYKKKVAVRHRDGHCEIMSVEAFRIIHEPGHPDADKEGFVKYPDISASTEQRILSNAREKIKKLKHTSRSDSRGADSNIDFD